MLISGHQYAGHNHAIKVANGSHENIAQFKYFGTAATNQNLIQKKLRGHRIPAMLVTIQFKTICLVCCLKMEKLEHSKL
jgi:adenosylmethionine-8-amino-7-oxononanoate aminotransferase